MKEKNLSKDENTQLANAAGEQPAGAKSAKRKFVLKNLSKKEREAILAGGAAVGGISLGALLSSAFTFPSESDVQNDTPPVITDDTSLIVEDEQDIDHDGIPNDLDDDIDGDGILNASDADMDGDGLDNESDDDDDGDCLLDEEDDHTPDYEKIDAPLAIETDADFVDMELDSMSFGHAFAAAREATGPGGFFEWRGNLYNTYTKEEWDGLSEEEQHDFTDALVHNSHFHTAHTVEDDDVVDILDIVDHLDDDDLIDHDEVVIDDGSDVHELDEIVIHDMDDDHDDMVDDHDDMVDHHDDMVDHHHDMDSDIADIHDDFDDFHDDV